MTHVPTHLSLIWIVAGAFALELLIAYPDRVFKLIGHPVSWMGALIAKFDRTVNSGGTRAMADFVWGMMLIRLAGFAIVLSTWALSAGLTFLPFGWVLELALIASLLAARSLCDHVKAVATALADKGLEAGRETVSLIVGRNIDQLDEPAIARAAVESLAESSSDGVVAPLFWARLGLPTDEADWTRIEASFLKLNLPLNFKGDHHG
ncbi:MAG: CobD/CbiB family cobalamin biosynthesis protein [Parvibaculum sp.]